MNKVIKQAFTLIELLVVIAIIGILSGLIVVSIGGMTQKATIAKAQIFSNSLRNSLMLNLISEYKLDGNGNDTWGSNSGTVNGATSYLESSGKCVTGGCYEFNKTTNDNYIGIAYNPSLNFGNQVTFSTWINPTERANDLGVILCREPIESDQDFRLYITTAGISGFFVRNNSGTTSSIAWNNPLDLNKWYFLTITYDGINLKYYVNGLQNQSPVAFSGNIDDEGGQTSIGNAINFNTSRNLSFKGLIDEVRFFNAAIPASQIKEQYYAGLNNLLASGQINKEDYQNRLVGIK